MNKKMRCVHIFPKFSNTEEIETIRREYDHLYDCIEPHITLVFPFESTITREEILKDIKDIFRDEEPFKVTAKGIEGVDNHGYYLFLNIQEGSDKIRELHYKIHTGILSSYQSDWTKDGSYVPHITIGRFDDKINMLSVAEKYKNYNSIFSTIVDRVYIEIIGENEESIIEGEVKLVQGSKSRPIH